MSVLQTAKNPGVEKKLFEFTHGIDVDVFLARQEIRVQKAWVNALSRLQVKPPILTQDESEQVCSALDEAFHQMETGLFHWRMEDEDIHMNVERFLVEKLGEVGKRVHLGRSRNDLIATTLRLFVNDSIEELKKAGSQLILALVQKSEEWIDHLIPGMTHLQHGQPIRVSHVLLAQGWALSRDRTRLNVVQKQAMSVMPLGSAALAGTTLPLDLSDLACELGFESPPLNSYDSVGDRDFLLDALYGLSVLGVHLSRLSEDLVYWASTPVSLIRLPRDWSTGSSIMPNKRNPDVPELIRGKSAHLISSVGNALTLMKGLPSGYNSDLHELKSVLIRSFTEAKKCLDVLEKFILKMEFNVTQAQLLMKKGHLLATELANQLTQKGMPFRDAYQKTAAWIELADSKAVSIEDLVEWVDPFKLSFEGAVESRKASGGTSRQNVIQACGELRALALQTLQD